MSDGVCVCVCSLNLSHDVVSEFTDWIAVNEGEEEERYVGNHHIHHDHAHHHVRPYHPSS